MYHLFVSTLFSFISVFFILSNNNSNAAYVCSHTPTVKECDTGSWLQWSNCSRSCGGGTQTRSRKLCCPPVAKSYKQCAGICNKTLTSLTEQRTCGSNCYHGHFIASQNMCRCNANYTGTCCKFQIVGPSSTMTVTTLNPSTQGTSSTVTVTRLKPSTQVSATRGTKQATIAGSVSRGPTQENNWKIPVICVGVILGVVTGCVLAWILFRRFKKKHKQAVINVQPSREDYTD